MGGYIHWYNFVLRAGFDSDMDCVTGSLVGNKA